MNFRIFQNLLLELLFLNVKTSDELKHAWRCSKLLQMHIRVERREMIKVHREENYFSMLRENCSHFILPRRIYLKGIKRRDSETFFS